MHTQTTCSLAQAALDAGQGILRLSPNWVPRSFCIPGKRIKLHPDDYYALGGERGGIDERWLASTTPAANGPLTGENEGLSFIVHDGQRFTLRDAVAELGASIVGERLWEAYHSWPMFSKFFDNLGPLPHHIHHREEHAKRVGQTGKPEAYYFPPQLNNHGGHFPFTFFGFEPGTTKDQVRACLRNFNKGDNRITELSKAYKLTPGTGWDVPPGILHAPGSLCTYEPQAASDIFAMYQSLVDDHIVPENLLWQNTPEEEQGNIDYLIDVIDWEANVDPEFGKHHFMAPIAKAKQETAYEEQWVCYRNQAFSASELTVFPGQTVCITDAAAYGLIVMQGHGKMGVWDIECPALIRYGQETNDEYFVSEAAAIEGVTIHNPSATDPIVMLKHFGPGNPDLIIPA